LEAGSTAGKIVVLTEPAQRRSNLDGSDGLRTSVTRPHGEPPAGAQA
jgi:hypothetical protein